jgi:hypothetical protein
MILERIVYLRLQIISTYRCEWPEKGRTTRILLPKRDLEGGEWYLCIDILIFSLRFNWLEISFPVCSRRKHCLLPSPSLSFESFVRSSTLLTPRTPFPFPQLSSSTQTQTSTVFSDILQGGSSQQSLSYWQQVVRHTVIKVSGLATKKLRVFPLLAS